MCRSTAVILPFPILHQVSSGDPKEQIMGHGGIRAWKNMMLNMEANVVSIGGGG